MSANGAPGSTLDGAQRIDRAIPVREAGVPRRRVVVVGAGAAGTAVASALLREYAGDADSAVEVVLLDPRADTGYGVAYRTGDPRHLLNTPAGRMSLYTDDPAHFTRWAGVPDGAFVARRRFGDYLADCLADTARRAGAARLRRVRDEALAVEPGEHGRAGGLSVRLRSGRTEAGDAVVLAVGSFPPATGWAPQTLRRSARFAPDPWAGGAVPEDGDVLLVGSGLTMADLAVTIARPGRVVHAVSRSGRLPHRHADGSAAPIAPPDITGIGTVADLHRVLRRHVHTTGGDWRRVVDGFRPVVPDAWRALPAPERQRFLDRHRRWWDLHRHRMPADTAEAIAALLATGRLVIHRGCVTAATDRAGGVQVELDGGRRLHVGRVVNCTGQHEDPATGGSPLVDGLLRAGLAHRDPLGLGLLVDPDGVPLGCPEPLWVVGALRRGSVWESTAFPEIRSQACALARAVPARWRATAGGAE